MSERFRYLSGVLSLVVVALILGSIPTALKSAMVNFSPSVQFSIRFIIGAVALAPFVRELNWRLIRDGVFLGLVVFACFAFETIGLETISANRASFIFGLNIVFVTLFELLFRQRISLWAVLASVLAFGGIGLMAWEGGEPVMGDIWLLGAALCDASSIILLEKFAPQHSPISLTAIRVWFVAILGLVWATPEITQQFSILQQHWGALHYLGIVATALVCWLYTIGMQRVPAYEAAIFVALEPLFGAVIAFFALGEVFGLRGYIGALMVLSGIVLVISHSASKSESSIELTQTET